MTGTRGRSKETNGGDRNKTVENEINEGHEEIIKKIT